MVSGLSMIMAKLASAFRAAPTEARRGEPRVRSVRPLHHRASPTRLGPRVFALGPGGLKSAPATGSEGACTAP